MLIKTKRENEVKATTPNLDCVLSIRMKNSDLNELRQLAKSENRTISNYVKTKLNITN